MAIIQVVKYANTRSVSYTLKELERAAAELQMTLHDCGPATKLREFRFEGTKEETLAWRKRVEARLKLIHRGIFYKFIP